MAVVLADLGRNDLRSVFGSEWWSAFAEDKGEARLSLLSRPLDERLRTLAGVHLTRLPVNTGSLVASCAAVLAQGSAPLVVSDAFWMPWVPYFGRIHLEHSFVVTEASTEPDRLAFVDAYENSTEWGDARPQTGVADEEVVHRLDTTEARTTVFVLQAAGPAPAIDRAQLLKANVVAMPQWIGDDAIERYVSHYGSAAGDLDQFSAFCLGCWEVARKRRVYHRWLGDVDDRDGSLLPPGFREVFEADVITPWAEINRFAYVNLRRLRAGRQPSSQVFDLVCRMGPAERRTARVLVDWITAGRHPVRRGAAG